LLYASRYEHVIITMAEDAFSGILCQNPVHVYHSRPKWPKLKGQRAQRGIKLWRGASAVGLEAMSPESGELLSAAHRGLGWYPHRHRFPHIFNTPPQDGLC